MKHLILSLMWFLSGAAVFGAPSILSTNAALTTNEMTIDAEDGFEYEAPLGTFRRNVHVVDPQMELYCELLRIYFHTNDNKVDLIVAETNVVIIQEDNWAIGEKAVFNVTNNILELTGNALMDTPRGFLIGEHVIYDRNKNSMWVPGKVRMGGSVPSSTNKFDFNKAMKPAAIKPPEGK